MNDNKLSQAVSLSTEAFFEGSCWIHTLSSKLPSVTSDWSS